MGWLFTHRDWQTKSRLQWGVLSKYDVTNSGFLVLGGRIFGCLEEIRWALAQKLSSQNLPGLQQLHSAQSGVQSSSSGHFTLGQHHTSYSDLSEGARKLDAVLYNVLKMSIKGSKQSLVQCVTFPSYVQAVCVLVKHMGISRMRRIMAAYSKLDSLQYAGDTLLFQSQFLAAKRELDSCKANLNHYMMCRLMKAFEGRSKTIQFKIADDFNKLDLDSAAVNFYDLVQGYCADLASVGDSKPHAVKACVHCQSESHSVEDCPIKKQAEVNAVNAAKNLKQKQDRIAKHAKLTCHYCGAMKTMSLDSRYSTFLQSLVEHWARSLFRASTSTSCVHSKLCLSITRITSRMFVEGVKRLC